MRPGTAESGGSRQQANPRYSLMLATTLPMLCAARHTSQATWWPASGPSRTAAASGAKYHPTSFRTPPTPPKSLHTLQQIPHRPEDPPTSSYPSELSQHILSHLTDPMPPKDIIAMPCVPSTRNMACSFGAASTRVSPTPACMGSGVDGNAHSPGWPKVD